MQFFSDQVINEMMISSTTPFSMGNSFGNSFATQMPSFKDQAIASPSKDYLGLVAYSTRTRADYLKNLQDILDVDAAKSIIDIFSEKTLYASKEEEAFEIRYKPKNVDDLQMGYVREINDCIEDFIERVDLYSFVKRISDKFLLFGEYPYRKTFEHGKGITELVDDISVSELVGIYENGKLQKFFKLKGDGIVEVSKESYGHFVLNPINVRQLSDSVLNSFEGGTVIMGKSILYSAIEQLKNLRTNQIVSLIEDIKKILRPSYYGVSVPETSNSAEVAALCRKYERDFRSPAEALGRDSANLSVNDIVYLAAQIRFIPQYSNNKGTISEIDVFNKKDDYEANLAKRNALLRQIAVLVGLPPSYLSPGIDGDQPGSKVADMKIYSRFAKKLCVIQDAIEEGIKDLVMQDIYYKTGYRIKRTSIDISFKSSVDSELLDAIEFTVGNVDIGDRLLAFVNNVVQGGHGIQVDPSVLVNIFNRLGRALTSDDIFLLGEKVDSEDQVAQANFAQATMGSSGNASLPPPPPIDMESEQTSLSGLENSINQLDMAQNTPQNTPPDANIII